MKIEANYVVSEEMQEQTDEALIARCAIVDELGQELDLECPIDVLCFGCHGY